MITYRIKGRIRSNHVWEEIRYYLSEHSADEMYRKFESLSKNIGDEDLYDAYKVFLVKEIELVSSL
ncbi:hypothetical protein KNT87_gp202 [Erwinia phage Cronus]|uniref:Uncharacterized protein n=1 Tax=Erwinia phage Cronus TaxID=2163633 RepID=A0A2S1GLU8_9CAUD|nr:hypothetical protein KNT87_gp202 [Erwinia phage Cronus]AWD90367.1 hypothetical protein [Erwinia phage Cronus]